MASQAQHPQIPALSLRQRAESLSHHATAVTHRDRDHTVGPGLGSGAGAPLVSTSAGIAATSSSVHHHQQAIPRGRALTTNSPPKTSPSSSKPLVHTTQVQVQVPKLLESPLNSNGSASAVNLPSSTLERKPSGSYGHHRQTSIVHGSIQQHSHPHSHSHSRNASSAAHSPGSLVGATTSPISAQTIAEAVGQQVRHAVDGKGKMAAVSTAAGVTMAGPDAVAVGGLHIPNGTANAKTGHSPSASSATSNADGANSFTTRRLERVQSANARLRSVNGGANGGGNGSGGPTPTRFHTLEARSVGEYALHHLFNSFIALADEKIKQCLSQSFEMRTESICGPGVDPALDQLISALGHIARQKPKPLIDTLMLWRKGKSEAANSAKEKLNQQRGAASKSKLGVDSTTSLDSTLAYQQTYHHAERQSVVSVYLLCRVLMEIFAQSTLADITQDMADRLEEIIYKQLHAADPEWLEASQFRQSNWVIFGQLLGEMSEMDFGGVADRFVTDLNRMQPYTSRKEVEGRTILVIRGMRWLRLKYRPEAAWDKTCSFLNSIANLAVNASGQNPKYAFNSLLEEMLLPVAAGATSELNMPKWVVVADLLKTRLTQMLAKPKHWTNVFPALVVVLCASPLDMFSSQWLSLIAPLQQKLKERSTRPAALSGICRLVWTYIFRSSDSHGTAVKNLTDIVRLVFAPGKKSFISTDRDVAEPLVQLIRIIGYKYRDLCFRNIIFPLMNSDLFSNGKDVKIADMEPEKIVIGIRGFLAIMADLENGEQPPFPVTFESQPTSEPFRFASVPLSPRSPLEEGTAKTTLIREERLSQPVAVKGFDEITADAYSRFCKILGDITVFCDNTFGGQAVLDEKFSTTPKTPIVEAFIFARRGDEQNQIDIRQGFYDLLHVAVQALPRCLSKNNASKPLVNKSLVNLLCTGTAHVQSTIAASSVQSLKAIAKQGHAQQVTVGFARFIFNFDDRYSTMSDGGLLGPDHIENTLKIYVELLQIWIEEIKQKQIVKRTAESPDEPVNGSRGAQLDLSSLWAHVDEIESHGLFFLCSPSRRVRSYAVTVLRLVVEFNTAMGQDTTRVISIMEGSPQLVINVNDEKLTVAERSRLQKALKRLDVQNPVIELCTSDAVYDSALWFKLFPNLIRLSFEMCPQAVTLTREIICGRVNQMQKTVSSFAILHSVEGYRMGSVSNPPAFDVASPKVLRLPGAHNTRPDMLIEQWRLYLVFACTTLTNAGPQGSAVASSGHHSRKSSKSSQTTESIQSAGDLFRKIIPLLAIRHQSVRDAVVLGLGSINKNIYRTLLEALQPAVINCNDEAKMRMANQQRGMGSPMRSQLNTLMRTEIAHVYKLTSHFLQYPEVYEDEWILNNLLNYTQELRIFLNDAENQTEWEWNKLRTHYCGLMEELYEGVKKTKDPFRWMSFQARKAAFTLMEDWCGYSPNQSHIRQREDSMRRSVLARDQELGSSIVSAATEIEKRDLKTAALSSMATLCAGPVTISTENRMQAHLSFDILRMLEWIEGIFNAPSDKTQAIGRRALTNLMIHNREHSYFLARSLEMCYLAKSQKSLESYFEVVTTVLTEKEDFNPHFWKVLGACLFTLGNENNQLRMKSARLLRVLEERQHKSSKLQELDISVSDKTIGVYKRAQFEMSQRLAQLHSELAFHVFSEFARFFKDVHSDHQRNMVAAMLPWIQVIKLQLDPNGGPNAQSYMVLANLFEITVRFGSALHNEIQALWKALATDPDSANVRIVLDFIITMCQEKKEQNFVDHARQIVVYIADTIAGSKVVMDFLLSRISPKNMILERDRPTRFVVPQDNSLGLPYVADLNQIFPEGPALSRQHGLSLGQLSLILLVDLMVAPVELSKECVPTLLHVALVLWDHYIPKVQDQAREMLVHLIHELVISKIDEPGTIPSQREIEDFIDMIRRHDQKVVWSYEDFSGKKEDDNELRVPESMVFVATEAVKIFSIAYPKIREDLSKTALKWASNCHVIHLACRSFQVFRSVLNTLEEHMLGDMLARLSNTIADDGTEVQTFAMEILTTLKTVVDAFPPADLIQYPQLFWTTCACLDTVHEREFMESLRMLEKLLEKLDLSDINVVLRLHDSKPPKWEGIFEGLLNLVYKGMRSSVSLDRTINMLEKLVLLPPGELVGDESGLLFVILANLPRYLKAIENRKIDQAVENSAKKLARVADSKGFLDIAIILHGFADRNYASEKDFVLHLIGAIKPSFFPELEFQTLVSLMSMVLNSMPWFRIKIMDVLCLLIPEIDMRKQEIASKGPDLITPLLRLLQTQYSRQALAVLDNVMTMNPTPMDNKHLRMSMLGANSSRAQRKECEKTQSLYGIPEETGWSIPVPANHKSQTRANVHSVFYTCATSPGRPIATDGTDGPTPKIELVDDEFTESYLVSDYRTATMRSDNTERDQPVGDLVTKLESLDDFFDDDDLCTELATVGHGIDKTHSNDHYYVHSAHNSNGENLYEQQTFPLLNKSLTRNASVSSFQNTFSDLRVSPSREAMVMTPTAFMAAEITSHQGYHGNATRDFMKPQIPAAAASTQSLASTGNSGPGRPYLHARSATSPVGHVLLNSPAPTSPMGVAVTTDEQHSIDAAMYSDDDTATMTPSSASSIISPRSRDGTNASTPEDETGDFATLRPTQLQMMVSPTHGQQPSQQGVQHPSPKPMRSQGQMPSQKQWIQSPVQEHRQPRTLYKPPPEQLQRSNTQPQQRHITLQQQQQQQHYQERSKMHQSPVQHMQLQHQQALQQKERSGGIRSGFRSGIRRLTGGSGDVRAREAIRQQAAMERAKSPQVPKVPDVYLVNVGGVGGPSGTQSGDP